MKNLKFFARIKKIIKNHEIPLENNENYGNLWISCENQKNNENLRSPCEIYEDHKKTYNSNR